METETELPDPEIGYAWGESSGSYFVRNPDGDVRRLSDDAMKLLELLADGDVAKRDLDGGALNLVEQLEDEGYLDPRRPVVRIVQPGDIRLWPRSVLFVLLLAVVAYAGVSGAPAPGSVVDLLTPTVTATAGGLLLVGVAIHETGHYLASRELLDPSIRLVTVNGVIPTVATNSEGAWMLPRNRRRWISLAGPFAELLWLLAVVAVHRLFVPTSTAVALYVVVALGSLAFTLNPLIHGDGYWLLVDTFDLVNLRKRGLGDLQQPTLSWPAVYVLVSYLYGVAAFALSLAGTVYLFGPLGVVPVALLLAFALVDWDRAKRALRSVAG